MKSATALQLVRPLELLDNGDCATDRHHPSCEATVQGKYCHNQLLSHDDAGTGAAGSSAALPLLASFIATVSNMAVTFAAVLADVSVNSIPFLHTHQQIGEPCICAGCLQPKQCALRESKSTQGIHYLSAYSCPVSVVTSRCSVRSDLFPTRVITAAQYPFCSAPR